MKAKIINPLEDKDWDHLILQHPESNFFHSSAWAKVLAKTYRHEPLYLGCFRGEQPIALLPMMEISSRITGRRGVGLPFTDSCQPLVFEEEAWEFLLGSLSGMAKERRWKHFELRGGMERLQQVEARFYEHTLELHGTAEEVFSRVSSASRKAIRKAAKNEVRIEIAHTRGALWKYYLLHIQTRRRHGLPPQPFSFFENIQEAVIEQGLGFVIIAHAGEVPIAGAVYFHLGKKAVYKFGASDERFQDFRGNNLVMWEGIQLLLRDGFESLYFGRTSWGNDGLRRFKLGWGTKETPLTYLQYHTATGRWEACRDRASGIHNYIFSNLPTVINTLAGAVIYPHLD